MNTKSFQEYWAMTEKELRDVDITDSYEVWKIWKYKRWQAVCNLRGQGKTYREIGEQLGISRSGAQQLDRQAKIGFYKIINPPDHPEFFRPMQLHEAYVVSQLKDFLMGLADGKVKHEHTQS